MRLVILILLASTISSCISSKKIDDIVKRYYDEKPIVKPEKVVQWYSINPETNNIATFSTSERTKSKFIPAILYWQWHTVVESDINKNITLSRFNNYLASNSSTLELPSLLNGNTIEFSFDSLPSGFTYLEKGYTIIFIVGYSISDLNVIYPLNTSYILNYKVFNKNGEQVSFGKIRLENKEVPLRNDWKTSKNFTWLYLDEYNKHQDIAFEELIKLVEQELRN